MDESQYKYKNLRDIVLSLIGLKDDLYRIDKLELELLSVKASFNRRIDQLYNSLVAMFGKFTIDSMFTGFSHSTHTTVEYTEIQPTQLLNYNNYESNGFGNHKTLLEEIKQMIIELKIKGSVRERANGLIEYRSGLLGSIYGRTKEEIEQQITKKLKEVSANNKNKGKPSAKQNKTPLLSEFFITEYLPYKKNQKRAAKTLTGYQTSLGYIKRAKFDKPLNQYKSKDIEDFLYSIPQTRTRKILQGFLNNLFNRCMATGLIRSNPCTAIETVQHKENKGKSFSFVEQKEFFTILFNSTQLTYVEKCYYLFVYMTGTRKDEALGLCVNDVDFTHKVLTIHGTKTDGSDRKMPLTPMVEQLLLTLDKKSGKYFTLNTYSADKVFRKVWNKEKGHKLHDLRHTFGTLKICVDKVDIKTVSLWMGHSTINTTLTTYTHPEQLDLGTFLRGDMSDDEKLAIYRSNYREISCQIEQFLAQHTQDLPTKKA